jgi:hypothetical protein
MTGTFEVATFSQGLLDPESSKKSEHRPRFILEGSENGFLSAEIFEYQDRQVAATSHG